jgi:hypothetical protein
MNAAVIKIKYANPPKDGKKQPTVRTDDNQIFGVWPQQFGLLQPGRTYKVEFSEREYQGKTYRTITKCEPTKDVEETPSGLAQQSQRSSQKDAETEFVARLLAASISACAVAHKEDALIAEARMLRSVYRQTFS